MAEVVDAIIADLIVRGIDQYERNFERATNAHGRFTKSVDKLKTQSFDLNAEGQKYKQGTNAIGQAEEQLTQRVTRSRKERADASVAADEKEVLSAKRAAKAKADAERQAAQEIAKAQREADANRRRYYAQGPRIFEAKAREISANNRSDDAAAARERAQAERAAAKAVSDAQRAEERARASAERAAEKQAKVAQQEAEKRARAEQKAAQATADALARESKAKADAEIAEAERSARYRAIADRAEARANSRTSTRRTGPVAPSTQPESNGRFFIPAATLNSGAEAEVAAEKQINALKVEQIQLEDALTYTTGARKAQIAEILAEMRLSNRLEAEGVAESEIALRLEQRRAAVAAERALANKAGSTGARGGFGAANEFALQASGGRFGYSFGAGALAGLGVTAAVGITAASVKAAIDYADALKQVSKEAGITSEALQVYHRAAEENGASSKDFDTALSSLTDKLAQARSGSTNAAKVFAALGVSIKGTQTAGELLPTLIDRLSKVQDQSLRSAAELALFGQSGQKLDGLLSGGNAKINDLADGLERTGQVLSSGDIAKLDEVSRKLAEVKSQLLVSVSEVAARNADSIIGLANAFQQLGRDISGALGYLRAFANSGVGQYISGPVAGPLANVGGAGSTAQLLTTASNPALLALRGPGQYRAFMQALRDRKAGQSLVDPLGTDNKSGSLLALIERSNVQAGDPSTKLLQSLNAPKGPKGPSADSLARQAEDRAKRFNDQMAAYDDRQLRAREDMTGSIQEQAAIENEIGQRRLQQELADIDSQLKQNLTRKGVDAALEKQRAAALRGAAIATEQAESDAREQDIAARDSQERERIFEDKLSADRESLDSRMALARTDKERLTLALQSLAKEQEAERASLQNQIDTAKPGTDVSGLQHRLNGLSGVYANRAQGLQQQYAGPFGSYINSLPKTAEEIGEEFQSAAVDGVRSLNDELANTIAKMTGLHGLAGQLLTDFIRIALQAEESKLFGGGGGSGGILSAIGSLFGGGGSNFTVDSSIYSMLPGFASGGSGLIGGNGGVDRNILSLNGSPIAKVGKGELLSITPPNAMPANQRVSVPTPSVTVLAPQHFDLSNAVMTPELVAQMDQRNRAYADAVGRASYGAAVQTAAGQAPGVIARTQTLKG